ncbi:MAG: T9SS type A sorting domain-containing protein [Bacteroidota bacterium]
MLSWLLCLMLLPGAGDPEGRWSARVAVCTPGDVLALARAGLVLEDARIRTALGETARRKVTYNTENGFVTVSGDEVLIRSLSVSGWEVHAMTSLAEESPQADSPPGLDTIPYQFGWPRAVFNGLSLYENSPTIADMNGDGSLEVSVTNAWGSYNPTNPPYCIVWRRSGAYLGGFPVPLEPGLLQSSADAGISAMGDITGDSRLEIVLGDENGYLYAFTSGGAALPGFPLSFGAARGVYTPALADMDGDGKSEIAVISHNWDYPYGNALLHLLKLSQAGPSEMPGFPIDLQKGAENSPALGDLDGDGDMEIVVATGGLNDLSITAKVIAFDAGGQVLPGFPWVVGRNSAGNSPTLYDLNGDGTLEILIRVKPDYNEINGIYALSAQGTVLPGYPFPITYGHPGSSVAVGDMTGDGVPELAYGGVEAVDSGKVWVYDLAGNLLPGFPARVLRTWVDGSVAIADADGDGLGDVICGTNGVSSKPGVIRAYNRLGQELAGFPLQPGSPILNSFETHPTVTDIDGDGDTEIFAGRLDMFVYGWDTPGLFDTSRVWRTFKGNAARTGGQLRSPQALSVAGEELPHPLRLYPNYPNPFNPSTVFRFELPRGGETELAVYDLLGRVCALPVAGFLGAGVHTAVWDASGYAGGVYLARLTQGNAACTRAVLLLR